MTYALKLDEPPVQAALLRYITVMGEALARLANAIEQGEAGRQAAIDELVCVQGLAHILAHRLQEQVDEAEAEAEADQE